MIILTLLAVSVSIISYIYYTLVYKYQQFYDHFKRQGLPCYRPFVSPGWSFLQFWITWKKSHPWEKEILADRDSFGSIYVLPNGSLMVNEPEYLSDILKKQGTYYVKFNSLHMQMEPILGMEGIVLIEGKPHINARKCFNPVFHSVKIKAMLEAISDITEKTIDEWVSTESRKQIPFHQEVSILILKSVLRILYGIDEGTLVSEIQVIVDTYENMTNLIYYRNSNLMYVHPLLSKLPICQKSALEKYNKYLLEFVNKIIRDRQAKRIDRDDLLGVLLSSENEFTDKQIREHVLSFITGGYHTLATALSWTMFVLMTKPTVYEACRNEVDTVLSGKEPIYDQLDKLEILNAVFHEVLRMYTPVPLFGRECIQEHFIGPYGRQKIHIPRGATIVWNTNAIHHSTKFWRDPEEFDYTRWMKDEDGNAPKLAHPCCFLPFSFGSRNCIGRSLAIPEATIILAIIIQRVNFEMVPGQEIIPVIHLTMKPKYDIYMDISKRSN
ncbi:unnamed protein product [Adineta ricciae]|uniref:Cytochrome P450 n=1 Tax=Adineta ricciae TaxID=249248 RepID=A0A815UCL2_ADIRI|nr:unnamed protein product [Adineta ricciae]CAF1545920.1 unnamed protein product [Adineta ricciae]